MIQKAVPRPSKLTETETNCPDQPGQGLAGELDVNQLVRGLPRPKTKIDTVDNAKSLENLLTVSVFCSKMAAFKIDY
jgi:hypothetical protein